MIVRDAGATWQIVLQTDHADLAAAFADAWAERGPRFESLRLAAERHDDGWAVWEQAPLVDRETSKPLDFLDVQVPAHLAFYRACITAIADEDPYAGLLVSMHGAGIYRRRYGRDRDLKLTYEDEAREQVEAFVAEQEAAYEWRMAKAGVDEDRRWADYELLQLFDRLSLYFCMRDPEAGETADVQGFHLDPVAPWRVRMEPFPFADGPARFVLLRRVLPKRRWELDGFRREYHETAPERVEIAIERA